MTTTWKGIAKESVGWSIALSVILILVGLLALAAPLAAGVAVAAVVAWLLMFSGFIHLVFAWHARGAGAIVWEVLIGLLYLLVGGYMLAHPLSGLVTLTLVLGAYLLAKGVMEVIAWFQLRSQPSGGWVLLDGIISLILAGMIWMHLLGTSAWVIGTMVGVAILFNGISRLVLSLGARRAISMLP